MQFIAFDLETTGTVASVDQIVEIGAVRFNNGEPEAIFATLVNPECSIPAGASRVNGITDDMLVGKPKIKDLLKPFADFCGELPMVAHNAPFDSQFLMSSLKKHEISAPRGLVLDTLPMAKKLIPGLANYKLGTLVQYFNLESSQFHRAEEDACYCGQVFLHLLAKISPNSDVPIENLVALTGKPEFRFPQIVRSPKQLDLFSDL